MQASDQFILKRSPLSRISTSISIVIVVLILAVLMAGWSLFWFLAAQQTESLLEAWTKREKTVDRVWT